MYCRQHDQIMEFRDKSFICAECDAERGTRFRGMFQLMTTGAPAATQGPRAAHDTPSLQEQMGVEMADPREELAEWRARAETAERQLELVKGERNDWHEAYLTAKEQLLELLGVDERHAAGCAVQKGAPCTCGRDLRVRGPVPDGWRAVPYEPTEYMVEAIAKLKLRRIKEAVEHGTDGPGIMAAAREEYFAWLGAAPWPGDVRNQAPRNPVGRDGTGRNGRS